MQLGKRFRPYNRFNGGVTPNSLHSYKGICRGAKALLVRLAQYEGKSGACFASVKTLAAEMGASTRTINNWLQQLVAHGFIERERRGQGATAVCYFLEHPALDASLKVSRDTQKVGLAFFDEHANGNNVLIQPDWVLGGHRFNTTDRRIFEMQLSEALEISPTNSARITIGSAEVEVQG